MKNNRYIKNLIIILAIAFMILAGILKIYLIATKQINEDEFMHLQWSWAMTQHDMPCRDFMMTHTPLSQVILMPFFAVFQNDTSLVFFARAFFVCFSSGTLVFMFLVARRLYGVESALLSLAVVSGVAAYATKSVEVRPDQIAALFGMIMIWLLARDHPRFFIAGLMAGLAIITNQKFIFMAAFVGIGTLLSIADPFQKRIRNLFSFGIAAAIPVLLFLAWYLAAGALSEFVRINLNVYMHGGNIGAKTGQALNVMRWPFYKNLFFQNFPFILFSLIGIGFSARETKSRERSNLSYWLWLYLAGMIALSLLTLAHELQQSLYLVPVLAIFCGHGIWSILIRFGKRKTIAFQSILLVFIVLIIGIASFASTRPYLKDKNHQQLATWNHILQVVPPGEYVMDGHAGMFVYRKNCLFYHSAAFVEARDIFYSFYDSPEDAAENIISALQEKKVRLVILEDVFAEVLPQKVLDYIENHYRQEEGYAQPIYILKSTSD